ncbi:MAG TPA: YdjY domain-containing protein [Tepidisphaeraceae bacterium]|nr:YdjY domain-containing protein [Tepidisphaeraceae bacterium]
MTLRAPCLFSLVLLLIASPLLADDATTRPLQHIRVDIKAKKIYVDCEALNVDIPLEFFCVADGGNEYESVLRTPAKPSDIHFALLMLGLKPGAPATFDPDHQRWLPPYGAPVDIACQFMKNGKQITVPACEMMRSIKTHKEMPQSVWVFDGSRIMPDGVYAADVTGYVVSICNFDLTMIDVPSLVSNSNDTLEWEFNPAVVPPRLTPVTMIISPATPSEVAKMPRNKGLPVADFNPGPGLSGAGSTPATQPN